MEEQEQEQSPFSPQEDESGAASPEDLGSGADPEQSDAPDPAGEPVTPSHEPVGVGQVEAAPDTGDEEFRDKAIQCVQCGAEFVHTASAQAFYKEKGFANEPKRCPACRKARKSQGGGGYSPRGGGGDRQMYPAVCADCGKETQVPFKPSGARPVYCLDCYRKQRGGG
jgi:CxxC-x17-CxxC domain-containing protein